MSAPASTLDEISFTALLEVVHALGRDVVRPAAIAVDKDARFPHEAFAEFKKHKLLSSYVPRAFGGMGLSITEICKLCEILGGYCASTAMVFAMHQIQVACIVHHCDSSDFFKNFLRELVKEQYLLASATTELGVGGDLRSSLCAVKVEGERFTLEKQAPVISYGVAADYVMVTCRRAEDAQSSDQVQVLVNKKEATLEQLSGWDTLGFRGTCSAGFILRSVGHVQQIQPAPFADILAQSMHPVSHLVWGSLWLGLAQDSVSQARASVRAAARKNPSNPPISAMRLTELDEVLFSMRSGLMVAIKEYQEKLDAGNREAFSDFGFSIRINNVKLRCSELVVDIVSGALSIVGIMGYKNDTPNSLCRHVRDAYGAALMVNNDRIRGHNSTMQIMVRDAQ
jgi:acyl-CoA dehydrogenase